MKEDINSDLKEEACITIEILKKLEKPSPPRVEGTINGVLCKICVSCTQSILDETFNRPFHDNCSPAFVRNVCKCL